MQSSQQSLARLKSNNPMLFSSQAFDDRVANCRFIIGHEDGQLHELSLDEVEFLAEREPDSDARPFPDFAGDLDVAPMTLDDITADGQPQPRSLPLPSGKKWLEHVH